jgi:hypothetical protein
MDESCQEQRLKHCMSFQYFDVMKVILEVGHAQLIRYLCFHTSKAK